jgi:hypothetical protein
MKRTKKENKREQKKTKENKEKRSLADTNPYIPLMHVPE